jgi:hypothetical protein
VYQIWVTAKQFGIRPSELVGVRYDPDDASSEIVQFEIDNAVAGLGRYIDNKLEELTKDGKRRYKTVGDVLATVREKKPPVKEQKKNEERPHAARVIKPPSFKRRPQKK